jgi:hypothetical protein
MIRDKKGNVVSDKENILQRWPEYNEKHFELQDGKYNGSGKEWTMSIQTAEPYVELPKDVDTEMAISEFKNGKANGRDPIPAELINEGGKGLKNIIYELI